MTALNADFGVIGLAVMGQNLARNAANKGFKTVVYNRTTARMTDFIDQHGHDNLVGEETLEGFVQALKAPRKILVMVKAGPAVDKVIEQLLPLLDEGDIIIDGGNSYYRDTIRREKELAEQGFNFFGCGVSGGEEGALKGPSLMPGGKKEVWDHLGPLLALIAAKDFHGNPCVTYLSENGAGHYVKMVHNGIEYAIMQMMAEAYQLLKDGYNLTPPQIADIFAEFQSGRLESFLFEISIPILRQQDPETDDNYLIDMILDKAGQKGTGRWTAVEAFTLGSEASTIAQAVNARVVSSQKTRRTLLADLYTAPKAKPKYAQKELVQKLEQSLYAAILLAYAQGFDLINDAAAEHDWDIDLAEVARIWEGGCIIRAQMLETLTKAFRSHPDYSLLQIPEFAEAIQAAWSDWRSVVALGAMIGVPMYCLSSALVSFEAGISARTSANFIQALRDTFGAHTYQRIDRDGTFHTEWLMQN